MPKTEQIMMSSITGDSSKNYIDSNWLELKKEYDLATKNKNQQDKLDLEKEKDDFAKMWIEAGLDLKETLFKNRIVENKKKELKKMF
tara:strand:+ start:2662 stop:2922 length:261 start_codon:yes stop_codon:yes gene_type:complete